MPFIIVALIILFLIGGTVAKVSGTTLERVKQYKNLAVKNGLRFGVDSALILAVITVESSGNTDSTGADGEKGLMQVMQATFEGINRQFGLGFSWSTMYDPNTNIAVGAAYLSQCLAAFPGSLRDALRAYNAGVPNAKKSKTISAAYADKVLSAYSQTKTI